MHSHLCIVTTLYTGREDIGKRLGTIYRKRKNCPTETEKNYEISLATVNDPSIGDTSRASLEHTCAPSRPADQSDGATTYTNIP